MCREPGASGCGPLLTGGWEGRRGGPAVREVTRRGSVMAGDRQVVVACRQASQRVDIDRKGDRPDAAVAQDELAKVVVRAAETPVGLAALEVGRAERSLLHRVG